MKYLKKLFLPLLLITFFLPQIAGATATVPSSGVWYTPVGAAASSEITLNALVYNEMSEAVTFIVTFKSGETIIGKAEGLVVAPKSAKTASVKWTMPSTPTPVVATVTSATNKLKKEIPSLVGDLGSVNVGGIDEIKIPEIKKVKGFFGNIINSLETFRLKQLNYFTLLKQKHQKVLGPNTPKDISDILKPEVPASPDTVGETADGEPANSHTMEYLTLVYASLGKSYFDHKAFFYVTVILVALFILKTIFSRFF